MKIANLDGHLVLVLPDGVVDVASASDGRVGPDPRSASTSGAVPVVMPAPKSTNAGQSS